ncbi:MAG: hypothetical protein EXR75_04665 [Myxococcales bacterium]|nr:hypothetical protein [Myxococcales bacterium]
MRREPTLFCAAVLFALSGCAARASGGPAVLGRDRPVGAEVFRAELAMVLDLEPEARCEESFDLRIYRDPRVELVRWDEQRGECAGRAVTIRYYAERLPSAELVLVVGKLVRKAHVAGSPQ